MPTIAYSRPLSGEQLVLLQQHLRSLGSAQRLLRQGSPAVPLVSSSTRTAASPRFIHGNSPLLYSFDSSPSTTDHDVPSPNLQPGNKLEGGGHAQLMTLSPPESPSSAALHEKLRSATRAVEELKEALGKQRIKRRSVNVAIARARLGNDDASAVKVARSSEGEPDLSCLETGDSQMRVCAPTAGHGLGLGLAFPNDVGQQAPFDSSSFTGLVSPMPSPLLPARRHWSSGKEGDCTGQGKQAKTLLSTSVYSPNLQTTPVPYNSAPSTPLLDNIQMSTPSTPVIARATTSSSTDQDSQTGPWTQQRGPDSATTTSTPHSQNALAVVVSVTAAGSILVLAAFLYLFVLRKRRSRQERARLDAVLERVAPPSQEGEKGLGIGSVDFFGADLPHSLPTFAPSPTELQVLSPWLPQDMGSHPFAAENRRGERFSTELAESGLVGHEPSRDNSFTWSFPKLSVPPAAARTLVASHYVRKRIALPVRSQSHPGRSAQDDEKKTLPQDTASLKEWTNECTLRTSSSSECVDPQIDLLRRSFAVLPKPLTADSSSGWVRTTLRRLVQGPSQQQDEESSAIHSPRSPSTSSSSTSRSTSQGSGTLSVISSVMRKDSAAFSPQTSFSGNLALTQAAVQHVLEISLPSLSIADSPMMDLVENASVAIPPKPATSSRITALLWSGSGSGSGEKTRAQSVIRPVRSVSSDSEPRNLPTKFAQRTSRRCSWAGPLEACREDSRESVAQGVLRSCAVSAGDAVQRLVAWKQDMTDTEDEGRDGYEAEQENDTEIETDSRAAPSTPLITLTSSDEEGRFERRISLTSAEDGASESQDGGTGQEDADDDEELSEKESSVVVHGRRSSNSEESTCHLDALDCLLADDFPTIPEWTPIQSPLVKTSTHCDER